MEYIKKDKGKVIALWSPVHGQGCVSTNTALISTFFSLISEDKKILILSSDTFYNAQYFLCSDGVNDGLSNVHTLATTGNLKKESNFSVYTKTITKNMDILGNSSKEETVLNNLSGVIEVILDKAKEIYDYIFLDTISGIYNQTTKQAIKAVDFIIINMPQDLKVIQPFALKDPRFYLTEFDTKEYLINISNYMKAYKHFPARKIERILKTKVSIISNNNFIHKALFDRDVIQFLIDEVNYQDKTDRSLIEELNIIYEAIVSKVGSE